MTKDEHGSGEREEYVLGTGADELARLGFQHQLWSQMTSHAWESAGFAPGDTVLDLGCGPGYVTFDLSHLVGVEGKVIAVDASKRFIDHLRHQVESRGVTNVAALLGDVTRLDLPADSLDGAFARMVLCFVEDPEAVVEGVVGALKPGGAFAVLDYCLYEGFTLAPKSDIFDRVIRAAAASFRPDGGNFDVGQDLPGIMNRQGLEIARIDPIVRVARPGSALWHWLPTFFEHYLPALVDMDLLTRAECESFWVEWRKRSSDPSSFVLTPPMVEVVGIKR